MQVFKSNLFHMLKRLILRVNFYSWFLWILMILKSEICKCYNCMLVPVKQRIQISTKLFVYRNLRKQVAMNIDEYTVLSQFLIDILSTSGQGFVDFDGALSCISSRLFTAIKKKHVLICQHFNSKTFTNILISGLSQWNSWPQ